MPDLTVKTFLAASLSPIMQTEKDLFWVVLMLNVCVSLSVTSVISPHYSQCSVADCNSLPFSTGDD